MNKNATPLILIVLSIGIYFTFTRIKIEEFKSVQLVNDQYKEAIDNSEQLLAVRDSVLETYNKIDPEDQERIEKIIPNNVDNVRLIIDVNGIATRHGLVMKNVKTDTNKANQSGSLPPEQGDSMNPDGSAPAASYGTATLSFDVNGAYQGFQDFLRELEASLRIIEVSKITLKSNDTGNYEYNVEIKTFWLKQ